MYMCVCVLCNVVLFLAMVCSMMLGLRYMIIDTWYVYVCMYRYVCMYLYMYMYISGCLHAYTFWTYATRNYMHRQRCRPIWDLDFRIP